MNDADRRENLEELERNLEGRNGSLLWALCDSAGAEGPTALARALGCSARSLRRMAEGDGPRLALRRQLEVLLGLPPYALDEIIDAGPA